MSTRLHIDWTRCDGHGACAELLPDVLTADEWGYPVAHDRTSRDPEVPAASAKAARHAVATCPLMALKLL